MSQLAAFIDALAAGDIATADRLVSPDLACETIAGGASRLAAAPNFIRALGCYAYAGDTALHFAAAGYQADLARRLLAAGADVAALNRLGGAALHAAATGSPDAPRWNPAAQAQTIAALVEAGADPNVRDRNGTTPLHRAVRTRCAAAVAELLRLGADPSLRTRNGSTAARLAETTSGRGGSGSPAAKAQQAEIVRLLAGQGSS